MKSSEFESVRRDLESFSAFLFGGFGYEPTRRNLRTCLQARLIDAQRKTHQPAGIALARIPEQADALRQRMNRTVLGAAWSDDVVRQRLRSLAPLAVPSPVAWVIDDTGVEKKGKKSPGVGRQYCGSVGKVTNCQLFVSTHLSGWNTSMPLEMDLYLPRVWCDDPDRRAEAEIPQHLSFRTKPELALDQVDRLVAAKAPRGVVLADAAYGDGNEFRAGLIERGLEYSVAIKGGTTVWRKGEGPDPVHEHTGRGHRPRRAYPGKHQPVTVNALAAELADDAFTSVRLWRGRHEAVQVRAAALRVRPAHKANAGLPPGPEQWLIVEWPDGNEEPFHYYLSNLPPRTRLTRLVDIAKLRWRVERDYQDLKQEVGFGHFEGRRWRGLNHHVTICMAALAFLITQRRLFPPQAAAVPGQHSPQAPG